MSAPGNPFAQFAINAPQQPAPAPGPNPFAQVDDRAPSPAGASSGAHPMQSWGGLAETTAGGFGQGLVDDALGGAQLFAHYGPTPFMAPVVDKFVQQENKDYTDARQQMGAQGFDVGRLAGNVLNPVADAGYITDAIQGVSKAAKLAKALIPGAYFGASQPVTTPGDYGAQKAEQVGLGSAAGVPGHLLGNALASTISPNLSSHVQTLLDRDVPLTPGQIMGGPVQWTEDKLTSVPVAGDFIKSAQARSRTAFNTSVANEALAPINVTVPSSTAPGQATVAFVKKTVGDNYDNLLPQMSVNLDPNFASGIQAIKTKYQPLLPPDKSTQLSSILDDQFNKQGGQISGDTVKTIDASLRTNAEARTLSNNPDDQTMGQAFKDARTLYKNQLIAQNPTLAPQLNAADAAYGNYDVMRRASSTTNAMGNEGIFTPQQLLGAVRANDKTAGKGASATGNARMQDLATAGAQVLNQKIPSSGTTERGALIGMLLGGGEMAEHPEALHYVLPAMAGLSAAYTKPGTALARMLLTSRPAGAPTLANAVRTYAAPGAGRALAAALVPWASQPSVQNGP